LKNQRLCILSKIYVKFSQSISNIIKGVILPIIFILLSTSAEGKTYIITTFAKGGLLEIGQIYIKEAYKRIGMNVKFMYLPAERALLSSNNGEVDGEIFRIDNVNKVYTNLLKVPTSFINAQHVAFSKILNIQIDGFKSLRPYRVGFNRGMKIAEQNMKGFPRLYPYSKIKQVFLMLNLERIDIVIAERITGLSYVKRLNLEGIKVLNNPLSDVPLFHYLHKKNWDLIPKLDAVFKDMKKEGVLNKIMKEYNNK